MPEKYNPVKAIVHFEAGGDYDKPTDVEIAYAPTGTIQNLPLELQLFKEKIQVRREQLAAERISNREQ